MIKYGKGVCGTAAQTKETQVVRDVHLFPGHIACDSGTNSEIVVPLVGTASYDKVRYIVQLWKQAKVSKACQQWWKLIVFNVQVVHGVLDIDGLVAGSFDDEDRVGLELISKILVEGCDWD